MTPERSAVTDTCAPGEARPRRQGGTKSGTPAREKGSRRRKLTLSPTRICTFLECPRKYRYVYIDRLPRYFAARAHFSFGTSLHRALQEYHAAGGAQTQDAAALAARLEESWISAGYESPEAEQARRSHGQEILAAYHEHAAAQEGVTLYTEKVLRADMGEYVLTGRVDRLDTLPDGALEVIDYKSGERLPTPEEVAEDLPMAIYQLLCFRQFECPRVVASIHHLRSGRKISAVRAAAEVQPIAAGVDALYDRIRGEEAFAPAEGDHCRGCDFYERCWMR